MLPSLMVCFLCLLALIVHVDACHDDRAFRAKINILLQYIKKNTTTKILPTYHITPRILL